MDQFQGNFSFTSGIKIPIEKKVELADGIEAKFDGGFELKYTGNFILNTGKYLNLEKFEITLSKETSANLSAIIEGKLEADTKIPLYTFFCPSIRFAIPTPVGVPIPIIITPVVNVDLKVSAEGTITIEGEIISKSVKTTVGFSYSEDNYGRMSAKPILDFKAEKKFMEDVALEVAGNLSVGPVAGFHFRFYNREGCYAGIDLTIPTKLATSIKFTPDVYYGNESLNPKLVLSTKGTMQLVAKIKLFGKKLFDMSDYVKAAVNTNDIV